MTFIPVCRAIRQAAERRREDPVFRIEEALSRVFLRLHHFFTVRDRRRQRLFADHVLPLLHRRNGHLSVQVVGRANVDEVDVGVSEHRAVVGVPLLDPVLLGERRAGAFVAAGHGGDSGSADVLPALRVKARRELRSRNADTQLMRHDSPPVPAVYKGVDDSSIALQQALPPSALPW